jgi:hypothetical protein
MPSRVVIGGVAAAAVIAGTIGGVAVAHPSTAPAAAPAASTPKSSASPGIEADPNVVRVAAQLGVTADRLLQALPKAKLASMAGGSMSSDAAAAAIAAELGVSPARAQHGLRELFGAAAPVTGAKSGTPRPPDPAITALAARLHVSTTRAIDVFNALDRMSNPGHGVDPASPAFAALANSLGKTPAQLVQILDGWKTALRSTMPKSPSPSPDTPTPAHS